MALAHDSQGFLVGEPLDVQALIEEWQKTDTKIGAIQSTLAKIEQLLASGAVSVGKDGAQEVQKAAGDQPANSPVTYYRRSKEGRETALRTDDRRSAERRPADPRSIRVAVEQPEQAKTVEPSRRGKSEESLQNVAVPRVGASETLAAKPGTARDVSERRAVEPKQRSTSAAEMPARDASGRFVGKNGSESGNADTAANRNRDQSALSRVVSRIADAVKGEADKAERTDPVIESLHEVAEPIGRGMEILGALRGGKKDDEQTGWLKRIFGSINGIRKDNSAYQTANDRRLKAIEKTTAENGGGSKGGFFSNMLGGNGLAGLLPALTTLGKRIPIIGAAFAGIKGLYDVWSSESDETLSREEKDKRTGTAVGGAAGSIGMGFLGAKAGAMVGAFAGPVGSAIGAALGGTLGLISGGEVGKQIGEWGGEIVSLFREVPAKMEASWNRLTDSVSKTWDDVKNSATDTFDKLGEKFGIENASEKLANAASSAAAAVGDAFSSAKLWVSELFTSDEEKAERAKPKKIAGISANPYDMRTEGENWEYFEMHRAAGEKIGLSPEEASAKARSAMKEKEYFHLTNEQAFEKRFKNMPLLWKNEAKATAQAVREETLAKEDAALAAKGTEGWNLGQTSARFESGGRGAGTVSSGKGDFGGASYGTYQLSSKTGTLNDFLKSSGYDLYFDGMKPGSQEFNAQWRSLAQRDENFRKAQHDFIKQTHFDPAMTSLKREGIDLTGRGAAVQDMVWSTANQFGAGNAKRGSGGAGLIRKAIGKRNIAEMSDEEIITAVQDYKLKNNAKLFQSSSAAVQRGTANRAVEEKKQLLALARQEKLQPKRAEEPRTATMLAQNDKGGEPEKASPDASTVEPAAKLQGPALYAEASSHKPIKKHVSELADRGAIQPADKTAAPQSASSFYQSLISSPTKPAAAATVAAASPAAVPAQAPAPAPAQPVETPLTSGRGDAQAVVKVEGDIGQDMKERGIAHIVTGGMV